MSYLCFAMGMIYVADLLIMYMKTGLDTSLSMLFMFSRDAILSGQIWRVFTYAAIPINSHPLWIVITLILYYSIGRELEGAWSPHKVTLYVLTGWALTAVTGFIFGFVGNHYIYLGLFLAYGTVMPHMQFRLFFMLPVEARTLAIADAIIMLATLVLFGDVAVIPAFVTYGIFFGKDIITPLKNRRRHKQFMNAFKHRNDDK